MAFPPNLFLIGAQKAGTTFLANLLDQHPDVCVSEPKEPGYLTRNRDRGLEWYRSRFRNPVARYLLDATTGYTSSPLPATDESPESSRFWGVPGRLKALSPQALLIYIVRDPVARTYSAYWHNVRAGHESRSFREAIAEDTYYLRTSRYYDQLALYRRHFSRERILVLRFEDLIRSPHDVLAKCYSFLSLHPPPTVDTEQGTNRSFTYPKGLSYLNRALSRVGGLGRVTKSLRPLLPSWMKNWLTNSVARKIPPISIQDRDYLAEYFAECNRQFAEEYETDTTDWQWPARKQGPESNSMGTVA